MKDDLIQYLINEAQECVEAASVTSDVNWAANMMAKAEEFAMLAERLLTRREVSGVTMKEAA